MAKVADSFRRQCSDGPAQMVSALVDSMPYPLIVRDMEYRVVLANESAHQRFGADLIGCKCYDIQELKDCVCRDCPAREAVGTGKPVDREVRDAASGRYLVVSVFPMVDGTGRSCGVIETVRDVTESRKAMDKIRALLGQVTSQNRELTEWRRSFEYELAAAREIQTLLVPPAPLCMARMCFDFLYRPSGAVGGDLYDLAPLDGGRVGLLVSDASGHGVGAALVAVMVKMAFRSLPAGTGNPAEVLGALNQLLVELAPASQFATAFYGVYDAQSHSLRYASGGHPAPLLLRQDGEGVERLEQGGMVLGSMADLPIEEREVQLLPGDKLLIYTDGVLDAANGTGERFGLQRLLSAASAHRRARGSEFLRLVVGAIDGFIAGARPTDDITLVLAEPVRPEGEGEWLQSYSRP